MRWRRGYAMHHVLAAVLVASAVACAWAPAFEVSFSNSARGVDRARARAVTEAAWVQARGWLERGRTPNLSDRPLLDGRASVALERDRRPQRVRVEGRVRRGDGWIRSRLLLDVRVTGSGSARRVEVLRRQELGA